MQVSKVEGRDSQSDDRGAGRAGSRVRLPGRHGAGGRRLLPLLLLGLEAAQEGEATRKDFLRGPSQLRAGDVRGQVPAQAGGAGYPAEGGQRPVLAYVQEALPAVEGRRKRRKEKSGEEGRSLSASSRGQ